ncbi:hypothetical protein [Tolypothrix sp. VBCCA 56010]|uniref:hypothetical protein n=1 Tax=Tolypothrix sp. VBCCA 56010 TaxID=3137731 RepID=UPI003D7C9D98
MLRSLSLGGFRGSSEGLEAGEAAWELLVDSTEVSWESLVDSTEVSWESLVDSAEFDGVA